MAKPKNFKQIQDAVRYHRADGRCECNGIGCRGLHDSRCPVMDGITPVGWKQPGKLVVTQIKEPNDWAPDALLALCQSCLKQVTVWRKRLDEEMANSKSLEAEMDPLFEVTPVDPRSRMIRED